MAEHTSGVELLENSIANKRSAFRVEAQVSKELGAIHPLMHEPARLVPVV